MFGVSFETVYASNNNKVPVSGSETGQQYTVTVSVVGESFLDYGSFSVVFYDKNNNAIQSDEPNTITCDEGSDINIALEGPIGSYYMKEIVVNGASLGVNEESNYQYPLDFGYSIENLSGNMEIVFKPELFIRYKTVYCSANGPGVVKMYKNGTYVGETADNGYGNSVVSVVIDHDAKDEIMLEFIPNEGCKFSELHRGFYDADLEQEGSEITDALNNNTYTIKYQTDEYSYSRMFSVYFESLPVTLTETFFPDAAFRAYVSSITGVAEGGTISNENLQAVKSINVIGSSDAIGSITDLKGIEYFTALNSLECQLNQLTSLDVSHNTALTFLDCSGNQLTSLDVSNNTALTSLICDNNQLTSLDVSGCTALTTLRCNNNYTLLSLDVTNNTALTFLYCSSNKLTELDVTNNTKLTCLLCNDNDITSLDVSNNTALLELDCSDNPLTSLNVSNNTGLTHLWCYNTPFTTIDVLNNIALKVFYCGYNQFTSLDLHNNTALTSLECIRSIASSTGSNQYCILVPRGFDISKASDFKVNDINTTPSFVDGALVFTTTSVPQHINCKYDVGNNVSGLMDVHLSITSIEEPNYDNTIYMDNVEVFSGTEAVLSVKMKNTVVTEGFLFDMYLPEGITLVQDEEGFPDVTLSSERTTSMKTNSFNAVLREDGSLRVLAASTNGSAISGNDGEVVQVKVAIADDMAEGDYTVCFKNIAISDENAESHTSAMTTSTIKVNTYIVGDANIDRKVDVADFTAVAHHLLNNTPQSFHQKAADANTDNRIDVGDLTAIAHLILYGTITKPTNTSGAKPFMMMNGSPADENYIYIEPVSVQGQSEVTLSVKMRNAVEAEGFEFDLYLPDGMSFVTNTEGFAEVSLSTERTNSKKTNSFDSVIQEDGSLRVLAASTNGSSICGNDGEVALVTIHIDPSLTAAEYPLLLKNIAIADVNAVSHSTDLKESTITILYNGIITGIDGVDEMDYNADWYTLDGKKLNSKPKAKGVYIMNGQKVVVK